MAFTLSKDEPDRDGLRRLLRKELKAAAGCLSGAHLSEMNVHEARKHIKKARAIVTLVRSRFDTGEVRRLLRHAARLIGPLRDIHAIRQDVARIGQEHPALLLPQTRRMLTRLLSQREQRARASVVRHDAAARAATVLRHLRRCPKQWHWRRVRRRHVNAAIQQAYRAASRSLQRARKVDSPEALHTFRKRAKALWYALRLLEAGAPGLRPQVARLREIQHLLGEAHNLHVLQAKATSVLSPTAAAPVAHRLASRYAQLRDQSFRQSLAFFAERPKDFGRRLRAARRSGRQQAKIASAPSAAKNGESAGSRRSVTAHRRPSAA